MITIKVNHIKNAAAIVVGYGTRQIVKAIIQNNTSPETRKDKFAIAVGTTAMTAVAISASKDYTDRKIDAYYNAWLGVNRLKKQVVAEFNQSSGETQVIVVDSPIQD